MADEAEDVLELGSDIEVEDLDEGEGEQTDGEVAEDEFIGFGDDVAAPATAEDSSVIRDLRKANREMAKKLAALDRANQPQKMVVNRFHQSLG